MQHLFTRREWLIGSGLLIRQARADVSTMKHVQVAGEWCFIGTPAGAKETERAVITFDGNGTTVGQDSSSWEKNAACTALSQAIMDAGMVVAQSNRTAHPDNGMWGNEPSQRSFVSLIDLLRREYKIRNFSALTVSAGCAIILNLLLDEKAVFDAVAMFAPAISLESMYRCPGGIDRVKGIAEAYAFQPLHGCPGDPDHDSEFRRATEKFDPMRRIRSGLPKVWGGSKTSWMILYHHGDPKVTPAENGGRWAQVLRASGAKVQEIGIKGDTHNSDDLMRDHSAEVVRLMRG
jgi:pimeloyl-ACP methyl ester carboxylesterase